jgi:beta-galactosidase
MKTIFSKMNLSLCRAIFCCTAFLGVSLSLPGAVRDRIVLEKSAYSFPRKNTNDTSDVIRVSADIPKDWKNKRVVLNVPHSLHKSDMIVFLNGEKVGEIYRPAGEIDLSKKLKYGEKNEISYILSQSGKITSRGESKTVKMTHRVRPGLSENLHLNATPQTYIDDVFANTSWRKKTLFVEVDIQGEKITSGELQITVLDTDGKTVKAANKKISATGKIVVPIQWENPVCWEFGRPYLYTCRVKLSDGDEFPEFKFGFREVWRDGKELMMNGHKLHLRPCYAFGAMLPGAKFLSDIGYNLLAYCHTVDACTISSLMIQRLEEMDAFGMGVFISCGGGPNIVKDRTLDDPETAHLYKEFQKTFHRYTRNHPSVIGSYVSQMIICDNAPHNPLNLGAYESTTARDKLINLFCDINRTYNPNIIYYSHADGNDGDLASGNLYLNWTPLQEREEWLSKWSKEGKMPWCSVEFGEPYAGCWYWQRLFVPTEHLASIYGPRAYAEEPSELLTLALKAGAGNKTGHGSNLGTETLPTKIPLFWELRRLWTWRTNSRWRAFGHTGGNIYFNLREAYGTPPGTKGYGRYGEMKNEVPRGVKPEWANEAWDIHQMGNKDFCAFIGGAPEFADNTHSYRSGEKIKKQAVLIWDGCDKKDVAVKIEAQSYKSVLKTSLKQGDIVKLPFEFIAPDVSKKTKVSLKAEFTEDGKTIATDLMELEIFPKVTQKAVVAAKKVYLFDPSGEGSVILKELGIAHEKLKTLAGFKKTDAFLIIGRNALSENVMGDLSDEMKKGLKIMVMAQKPDAWQSMGFNVQDPMTREVFASSKYFKENTDQDELRLWRGAPVYGDKPYGHVMNHSTLRGPRWTRRHTVAGLMLQIPPRVGFTPLMNGLFDLEYSPLLRFAAGDGSITFCTLDLEGRVPSDPAASKVAKVMFDDFFTHKPKAKAKAGEEDKPVILVAENVYEGDKIYRAKALERILPTDRPELRRWTAPLEAKVSSDGSFTVDRTYFAEKAKTCPKDEVQTYLLNQMKVNRLYAAVLTHRGVEPSEADTKRIFYQAGKSSFQPLTVLHVCGPFAAKADDSKLMLDTIWNKQVEEMAKEGDYNPNFEFKLPQGGTSNWRAQLPPDQSGCYNFATLSSDVPNQVNYAVLTVDRKKAGKARIKLGADWRLKMWVNGKEEFRCDAGAHFPKFELFIPLKEGKNVIAFKIGGGRSGCKLWALFESEQVDGVHSKANPELDAVILYDNLIPGFDPYQFHYW